MLRHRYLYASIFFLAWALSSTVSAVAATKEEHACDAHPKPLAKQIILEFQEPQTVSWLVANHAAALEQAFLETYNELSFEACDRPHFRQLLLSTIHNNGEEGEGNNNTNSDDPFRYYRDSRYLVLEVEGQCHNCTDSVSLFDVYTPKPITTASAPAPAPLPATNDTNITTAYYSWNTTTASIANSTADTTLLPTPPISISKQGTRSHQSGSCFCPTLTPTTNSSLSLTVQDFLPRLNHNLRKGQLLTLPSMDTTAVNLIEILEVPCGGGLQNFTSFASLEMDLSSDQAPSAEGLQAMETAFREIYNQISFGSCDPYFRTITQASLDLRIEAYGLEEEEEEESPRTATRRLLNISSPQWGSSYYNDSSINTTTSAPWNTTTTANTTNGTSSYDEQPGVRHTAKAVFSVQGLCRNCPVTDAGSFTLFDDAIFRRRLLQGSPLVARSTRLDPLPQRQLQTSISQCTCPSQPILPATVGGTSSNTSSSSLSSTGFFFTQESFLDLFHTEVEQLVEEGVVPNDIGLANDASIEEAQTVRCGAETNRFYSEAFTDIRVDLNTITPQELSLMEQAFQKTYNRVTFSSCDGSFRTTLKVELRIASEEVSAGRRLRDVLLEDQHVSNSTNSTVPFHNSSSASLFNATSSAAFFNTVANSSGAFINSSAVATDDDTAANASWTLVNETRPPRQLVPTVFAVTGQCRNCDVSDSGLFNLFDDGFRRRRLQETQNNGTQLPIHSDAWSQGVDLGGIQKEGNEAVCLCLAGTDPQDGDGPTIDAFEEIFTSELAELQQQGLLASVVGSGGSVLEGSQISCSGGLQDFTTYINAEFSIDPRKITNETKELMESAFLDTYNHLSFGACDEYFRVVSDVGLVVTEQSEFAGARERQLVDNTTISHSHNGTRHTEKVYFKVTGHCRNCPISAGRFTLFDDAFRRRTLDSTPLPEPSTANPTNQVDEALDVCFCPQAKYPGEEPPPSEQEFLEEFNLNLIKAQTQNGNDEEVSDESIEEIADDVPPQSTSIPTSAPESYITAVAFQEVPLPVRTDPESILFTATPSMATTTPTKLPRSVSSTKVPTSSPSLPPLTLFPTPLPSLKPSPQPAPQPTLGPTRRPTRNPTRRPTRNPTRRPTQKPTAQPTPQPTWNPTPQPVPGATPQPSRNPTRQSTPNPSPQPTQKPTAQPTPQPTLNPTPQPVPGATQGPSPKPTFQPTPDPSHEPSPFPTPEPTPEPTSHEPSPFPTPEPTPESTLGPSLESTIETIPEPSQSPSDSPTFGPTIEECNETHTTFAETFFMLVNGTNVSQVSNSYLIASFQNASQQMEELRPSPCVPIVLNSTISNRPGKRLRRRLQQQLQETEIISFLLQTMEVQEGDILKSWYTEPFMSAFNSLVEGEGIWGVFLAATSSPSLSPSLRPSTQPVEGPSTQPSLSPSLSSVPNDAPSPQPSLSNAPSNSPSYTPSSLPTLGPSAKPSNSNFPSSMPSFPPSTSQSPSQLPSQTPSHVPSQSPSLTTSMNPSLSPSLQPSTQPSHLPTTQPSQLPSQSLEPSSAPSLQPSLSHAPTDLPTSSTMPSSSTQPSYFPTGSSSPTSSKEPSLAPSLIPSESLQPSGLPSNLPSPLPSLLPSVQPSTSNGPSSMPSHAPSTTQQPSHVPSATPSEIPSQSPSLVPSLLPSTAPSFNPTNPAPSSQPSTLPSAGPSMAPSITPTVPAMSGEPSNLPSNTPSTLPSVNPSNAPSIGPSESTFPSLSPSSNPTGTSPTTSPSDVPSGGPSASSFPSNAPSLLPTRSTSPSSSPSSRPSNVPTNPAPSAQPSNLPSTLPSMAPSFTPTNPAPSAQPSNLPSTLPSTIPSSQPSNMPSTIPSMTPSTTPTNPAPSSQPSSVPSAHPSMAPSATPTNPAPSSQPSSTPSAVPSMAPSVTPTNPAPSSQPSNVPSTVPSMVPSAAPTNPAPSSRPSSVPSALPSMAPSATPSNPAPSSRPSSVPSALPSMAPSATPTNPAPSSQPSSVPSALPSMAPSATPTNPATSSHPSSVPSTVPSMFPSAAPTNPAPSSQPSGQPSAGPSATPTNPAPSSQPSALPSAAPSATPTNPAPSSHPSGQPSSAPSVTPTNPAPSSQPSGQPSATPSATPTNPAPSSHPSGQPSSVPSATPTNPAPSSQPSSLPSTTPSQRPSAEPSVAPTVGGPVLNPVTANHWRNHLFPNKCLSWTPSSSPAYLQVADCDENDSNQEFVKSGSVFRPVTNSGRCLRISNDITGLIPEEYFTSSGCGSFTHLSDCRMQFTTVGPLANIKISSSGTSIGADSSSGDRYKWYSTNSAAHSNCATPP